MRKMSQTDRKRSESRTSRNSRPVSPVSNNSHVSKSSTIHIDENNTDLEDYRKLAKKLAKDKSSLKDKLRKLLDEVDSRTDEHRVELEKTQNYFQTQIYELTEERDKAYEDLEKMRTASYLESEKIRKDFEDKLSKHKDMLEKRYGNSSSSTVKRLEATIATLQNRLNDQIEERENVKHTSEQYFTQKEEQLRQQLSTMEEQLRQAREAYANERRELAKISKTFSDEKEQLKVMINKERDTELKNVISEKDTIILELRSVYEQSEKRLQLLKTTCDQEIENMKYKLEQNKLACERKLLDQNQSWQNKFSQFKEQIDGQNIELKRVHDIALSEERKKCEKIIADAKYTFERENSLVKDDLCKEIKIIQDVNVKLKTECDDLQNKLKTAAEDKLKEERDKNQILISKLTEEFNVKLEGKNKDLNEAKLRSDKVIGEMEENNIRLKERIVQLESNIKKLQENSAHINAQFVNNLNKQKEVSESEIAARDKTIAELNRQFKNLGEESIDRFNSFERKIKSLSSELDENITKYNTLKALFDKDDEVIANLKIDLRKQYEITDLTTSQNRQLLSEIEGYKEEIRKAEENCKKAQEESYLLRSNVAQYESKLKAEHDESILKKDKEVSEVKQKLHEVNGENQQLKTDFLKLQENFRATLNRVTAESKVKDLDVIKLQNAEKDLVTKDLELQELRAALRQARDDFRKDLEQKENSYKLELSRTRERLNQVETTLLLNDQKLEEVKLDYLKKLTEARSLPPLDQQKMEIAIREKGEMEIQLHATEKKLEKIQYEFANATAMIRNKLDNINERETEVRKLEEKIRNEPPRLLDPTIKKARDDALAGLRESRLELNEVKERVLELTQKLQVAEGIVKDLEKEKRIITESQADLKQTFVENLNHQRDNHEKEIARKDERIKELEQILVSKLA